MSTCIPKHIACGWYTPEFIAGPVGCTMPVADELRSRLLSANTLFRSIDVGIESNNISIKVTQGTGTVTLDVALDGVIQESYTVNQSTVIPIVSGIPQMRIDVNSSSSLITLPEIDVQTSGSGSIGDFSDIWEAVLDDGPFLSDVLTLTNLSGGNGFESDPTTLNSIRTGPTFTMVYINQSEQNNIIGEPTILDQVRYWNGACWKLDDINNPDCSATPPVNCSAGPSSDCP